MLLEKESDVNIYYDEKKIIKCPYCNIILFYINNYWEHECSEKIIVFVNEIIDGKKNEFLCDINNIENKCIKHNKEFSYYKYSNYYCIECLKENNLNDFIKLEEIILSKEEKDNFCNLIKNFEDILYKKIILKSNDHNLKESFERFMNRNKKLLNICKNLIKFNEKYEKNFNLISTIRRISIDFKTNKINNKDLINYYNQKNIIKFNNDLKYEINKKYYSYFLSEHILQKGKYYLGKKIGGGTYGEVYNALYIPDKKLVAIKKLKYNDEEENEREFLKYMKDFEYSVKYVDFFTEKNNKYIVTELCGSDLRKELSNKKNGFNINEIKKIFCQINIALYHIIKSDHFHRDLKPENILIKKITKKDKTYNIYKICDYGMIKDTNAVDNEYSYWYSKVGTSPYSSDSVLNQKYKKICDIFSIGIILYELYYKFDEFPYEKSNQLEIRKNVLENIKKGLKIKNEKEEDINEFNNFKDLIEKCTKDENNRINWIEYFNHPFFNYEIETKLKINEEDLNNEIYIIGNDFEYFNETNTELYIDNKKEIYKKEYIFNETGIHMIKFKFNIGIKICDDDKSSSLESLENMFNNCENIESINFNVFNTNNITNMRNMFYGCNNLSELDLSSFNTNNVINMSYMFYGCEKISELDLSFFNTNKVTDMSNMFSDCKNLIKLDLSSFNTYNINDMSDMFSNCEKLSELDLSSFNTYNVTEMSDMFSNCYNLPELDLSSFNAKNVASFDWLYFYNCSNLNNILINKINVLNIKHNNNITKFKI